MSALLTYAGLSLDSLFLCLLLSRRAARERSCLQLVALLGLADGFGTLAAGRGGAGVLLYLAACALAGRAFGLTRRGRWLLFALPVLLGVDNLLSPGARGDALAAGLASASMAACGLLVAEAARRSFAAARARAQV